MRPHRLITPIFAIILCLLASCDSKNKAGDGNCFVCTGPKARVYHSTSDCKGLTRCSEEVREVSIEEAKGHGRRPCRICE